MALTRRLAHDLRVMSGKMVEKRGIYPISQTFYNYQIQDIKEIKSEHRDKSDRWYKLTIYRCCMLYYEREMQILSISRENAIKHQV